MFNKNIVSVFVVIVLAFLISGCATSGNESLRKETEESVKQKIVENVTTKQEIKAAFGSPDSTQFTDGGKEIWNYSFIDASADGVNYIPIVNLFGSSVSGTQKKLTILFDGEIVQKYSMSESEYSHKTGLFSR